MTTPKRTTLVLLFATTIALFTASTRHETLAFAQRSWSTTTAAATKTRLFGKKKKNKKAGGGGGAAGPKIQVKLLHHIAGTGQAGDVILVNPVFFDNKLRPQKLARVITDEEVEQDLEDKQQKSDELRERARSVKDLLDCSGDDDDDSSPSSFVLGFRDNQTGPDGKKLFGGIGPKKLMDSLRKECKEFESFSKQFTKQVSIVDIEEEETVEIAGAAATEPSKYRDYSSGGGGSGNNNNNNSNAPEPSERVVVYTSLPKKDKMTIKHTGVFRMKVSLTKDLFARVKVTVEGEKQ